MGRSSSSTRSQATSASPWAADRGSHRGSTARSGRTRRLWRPCARRWRPRTLYTRGHRERVSRRGHDRLGERHAGQPGGGDPRRRDAARCGQARGAHHRAAEGRAADRRRSSRPSSCTPCAAWTSSRRLGSWARPWPGSCTRLAPDFPNNCSGVFQLPSGDIIAQFVTAPGPGAKPITVTGCTGTTATLAVTGHWSRSGTARGG
jgi:hypothetical protein